MSDSSLKPAKMRRLGLLTLAVTFLVILGACGDSATSTSDSTEAMSDTSDSSDNAGSDGTDSSTETTADPDLDRSTLFSSTIDDKTTPTTVPPPSNDGDTGYDPGLQPLVEMARADLADRLDIDAGQIAVSMAELRAWPNSANGCPRDGIQYMQVVTDGSEIVLEAGGTSYRYTTGGAVIIPQICAN